MEHYGQNSGVLVLNLGPAWGKSNAYDLFQDNVIEIAFKEWESPPGLGICPLDVIFSVCHTASSWLAQNEKHVVVSFSRWTCCSVKPRLWVVFASNIEVALCMNGGLCV